MTPSIIPFSLKDAPALIERLLPVQKLSAEAYKEQMAGSAKTLTALGSYVKGTVLLVLRKRSDTHKTTRDDLAWEIQEEVEVAGTRSHRPQPGGQGPLPRRKCL